MQKLNGREIYVLVIIAILTFILGLMLTLELVGDYSSLRTDEDGSVSINRKDLINNVNTLFQVIIGIAAFVLLIRKRPTGWVLALPLLTLFAAVTGIYSFTFIGAGIFDLSSALVSFIWLIFLTSVIFLLIPSTLRKFNVTRKLILFAVLLFALMVSVYFIVK